MILTATTVLFLAQSFVGGSAQCLASVGGGYSADDDSNNTAATLCGGGGNKDICQQVTVIDASILDDFCNQPVYYTFLPNDSKYADYDNICFTMMPLKGSPTKYTYYYSIVFKNGTNMVESYLISSESPGINQYAGIGNLFTEYIVGKGCGDSNIIYSCGDSEESKDYVYGTTADCGLLPYSEDCLRTVSGAVGSAGLPDGEGFIALPNRLPKRCQTQNLCLPASNPLSQSQNGSCAPYDGTDCKC